MSDVRVLPHSMARMMHTLQAALPMLVICRPTKADYPGLWIARLHITLPAHAATPYVMLAESQPALWDMVPEGLAFLARAQSDDPVIEGCFL